MWTVQRRRALAPTVPLAWMLLAWSPPCAFALNPALDISQYAHTALRIRDGFSKGTITSIAQTQDGYLWLGTELGLVRFDGVRAVPWQPPPGQQLPSSVITRLLATRDGALWIGTDRGLAKWQDGKCTRYEPLAERFVGNFIEDHQGSIWAPIASSRRWTLCELRPGNAECHGEDGGPGAGAVSVYEDRTGQLWVGTAGHGNGLWRWKPDVPKFYPLPQQPNGIQGLSEDTDGALLISLADGVHRFVDGEMAIGHRLPPSIRRLEFPLQLRDRDGGLWLGSASGGLVHFHDGISDTFTSADGLSGDRVYAMFEDREGNVWVATTEGLDRFRDVPVATYSTKQGLSNANVASVLATSDGSTWMGTADRANQWNHGRVTSHSEPAGGVLSTFQDSSRRVWLSTTKEVGYIEGSRFVALKGVGGGQIRGIAEDSDSNVWIANQDLGLFRFSIRTGAIDRTPWDKLKPDSLLAAMAADRSRKGVWLGYRQGALLYFADDEVRATYGTADGLGAGIRSLQLDREGTLWAATDGGLSRVKNGRVSTLTTTNGLPCDGVEWLVEDDDRAQWLGTRCGLVRIARAEIAGWASSLDTEPGTPRMIDTTVFDNADGVRTYVGISYYSQPAVKGADGRLWFMSQGGVSVVDPRKISFNSLPPPVHIEGMIADRKTFDTETSAIGRMTLPALTRDLQIDYTALSLVAPEKNRFKIKLEGWDREWQDMGNRRQVFYSSLPPRSYRFRVIASNNSGVWNEAGAVLDFAVAPAYYQTLWFRVMMAAAAAGLALALYQLRLRRLAWHFNMRLEERVNERTRVARDLHDTLLQSFHAVVLRLRAVTFLPPAEARQALENVIDDAGHAIVEARDAVQGLRSATLVNSDFPSLIGALGEELTGSQSDTNAPALSVNVEGRPRDIVPIVRDEIYRITREALRNSFRHAAANRVQVEIRYAPSELRVRVRDDGKGVDQEVVDRGGRAGHYGLAGMRERAELMNGTLTLWSERGSGTEVELTIPASVAYAKSFASPPSTSPKQPIG